MKGTKHLELKEIDCGCREEDTVTRILEEIKYEERSWICPSWSYERGDEHFGFRKSVVF